MRRHLAMKVDSNMAAESRVLGKTSIRKCNSRLYLMLSKVFDTLRTTSQCVQDDTQLEKLAGFIEGEVSAEIISEFLEETSCLAFLESASYYEKPVAVDRMVLGLRLAAHLFSCNSVALSVPVFDQVDSEPGSYQLCMTDRQDTCRDNLSSCEPTPTADVTKRNQNATLMHGLWHAAEHPTLWEDGSVRHAWVKGLVTSLTNEQALTWIYTAGYLPRILQLLQDTSMFVCKTARILVAQIIKCAYISTARSGHPQASVNVPNGTDEVSQQHSNSVDQMEVECTEGFSSVREHSCLDPEISLLQTLFKFIIYMLPNCDKKAISEGPLKSAVDFSESGPQSIDSLTGVPAGLLILEELVKETSGNDVVQEGVVNKELWQKLESGYQVSARLIRLLEEGSSGGRKKELMPCMTVLTHLYKHDILESSISMSLRTLPRKLHGMGDLDSAIRVAAGLAKINCGPDSLYCELLKSPLSSVLDPSPAIGIPEICRTSQHLRLALNTVKSVASHLPATFLSEILKLSVDLLQSTKSGIAPSWLLNARLHLDLLDTCRVVLPLSHAQEPRDKVLDCCLNLVQDNQAPPVQVQCAFACIVICVTSEAGSESLSCHAGQKLACNLQRCLCHPEWEVRDTAVETIHRLAKVAQGNAQLESWLVTNCLLEEIWRNHGDSESYVRAAVLSSLPTICDNAELWASLLLKHSQDEIVDEVMLVTKQDTEAFARRAALNTCCAWADSDMFISKRSQLYTTINECITDLDWEIKLCVLDFLGKNLRALTNKEPVPQYAIGLTASTCDSDEQRTMEVLERYACQGCFVILVSAMSDHDPSVQHRACCVVNDVGHSLRQTGLYNKLLNSVKKPLNIDDQYIEQTCQAKPSLRVYDFDLKSVSGFLQYIESLDLGRLLEESDQSTDEYSRNPLTLLEDILTSLKHREEETIIDCY